MGTPENNRIFELRESISKNLRDYLDTEPHSLYLPDYFLTKADHLAGKLAALTNWHRGCVDTPLGGVSLEALDSSATHVASE